MPAVFFIACGKSTMQPVYVGDVAEAMSRSLGDRGTWGKRYELCGPETFTLKQLVQYTARVSGQKRWVIGLGPFLSRVQAVFLGLLPGKPMTLDNYRSLQVDSCCGHNSLGEFGITPTALDAVVPRYIGSRNRQARLQDSRREYAG
jgi:NADH dehydrogenase